MDVETVHRRLAELGVEARKLMGGVLNQQPGFWNFKAGGLANAHALADSTLFLGIHQTLSDAQVNGGVETLESIFR